MAMEASDCEFVEPRNCASTEDQTCFQQMKRNYMLWLLEHKTDACPQFHDVCVKFSQLFIRFIEYHATPERGQVLRPVWQRVARALQDKPDRSRPGKMVLLALLSFILHECVTRWGRSTRKTVVINSFKMLVSSTIRQLGVPESLEDPEVQETINTLKNQVLGYARRWRANEICKVDDMNKMLLDIEDDTKPQLLHVVRHLDLYHLNEEMTTAAKEFLR